MLTKRMCAQLLKGTQRKMIKIAGCSDTVFEEAYFVLKPGGEKEGMSEREIIAEANRIIRENSLFPEKRGKRFVKMSVTAFFILVSMSVTGVTCAAALIVALL